MKFIIATFFIFAIVMGVHSSVIPWYPGITQIAGGGLSYTAVSGPLSVPIAVPHHAPAAVIAAASPILTDHGVPITQIIPAPAPVVVAQSVPVSDGAYVAQTRGAVHTAPLPGHISSVANVNVAPPPGSL